MGINCVYEADEENISQLFIIYLHHKVIYIYFLWFFLNQIKINPKMGTIKTTSLKYLVLVDQNACNDLSAFGKTQEW